MNPIFKALFKSLLEAGAGMVESAAEMKLVEVLQKLHDNDPARYKAAILGGLALVAALKPITDGTATKLDDAVIDALKEALETSAAQNGVDLTQVQALDDTDPDEHHGHDGDGTGG